MFFLLAGLILALIVVVGLCGILFVRVRKETPRRERIKSITEKGKLKNIE
jgi:hypothetical protein